MSSMKINNKTFQTPSSCYACFHRFSSYHNADGTFTQTVLVSWCLWDSQPNGLCLVVLMGLWPKWSYTWCRWDSHPNGLSFVVPMRLSPKRSLSRSANGTLTQTVLLLNADGTLTQTVLVQRVMFSFWFHIMLYAFVP
jgi:hypothetical protein